MQTFARPSRLELDDLMLPEVQRDLLIREPNAKEWLNELEEKVQTICKEWDLTPMSGLHGGRSGCVVKVTTPEVMGPGAPMVLKIALNTQRAEQETAALNQFAPGETSVKVYKTDFSRQAMLLEWVNATRTVRSIRTQTNGALPDLEELKLMVKLLKGLRANNTINPRNQHLINTPRLEDFHRARLQAAGALKEVAKGTRPPTPANLARAIATLDFLSLGSNHDHTLIHGDLNSGNVLYTETRPVALDPRPLRGDPTYDTAVLAFKRGEKVAEQTARLLCAALGDDLERVLCWLFIARVSRI